MPKYKATDEQFSEAVKTSFSISEVLVKIGYTCRGNNYSYFRKRIEILNLDISHFKGRDRKKGEIYPIEDYLLNKRPTTSYKLKKKLIKEKFLEEMCSICHLKDWQNSPIPLELDHINGNNIDNSLSNLRLLCRNCHGQTDTFCSKNRKIQKSIKYFCINENCKKEISYKARHCITCLPLSQWGKGEKINWPSLLELEEELKILSYKELALKLKIGESGLRNHIKTARKRNFKYK